MFKPSLKEKKLMQEKDLFEIIYKEFRKYPELNNVTVHTIRFDSPFIEKGKSLQRTVGVYGTIPKPFTYAQGEKILGHAIRRVFDKRWRVVYG